MGVRMRDLLVLIEALGLLLLAVIMFMTRVAPVEVGQARTSPGCPLAVAA
jgi:hypothetical protein